MSKLKSGAELIAEERRRQIEKEGWSAEHDDGYHKRKELAMAAESYLVVYTAPDEDNDPPEPCWNWPWAGKWWKPSEDPVRNLVKAGALIAAEIDRLQRKTRR